MTRHLDQMHNFLMSFPIREILLFDYDTSGTFRHVKLHPKVVVAHIHSFGQTL